MSKIDSILGKNLASFEKTFAEQLDTSIIKLFENPNSNHQLNAKSLAEDKEVSESVLKLVHDNKKAILSEILNLFDLEKEKKSLYIDPNQIIFDLPSEFLSVNPNSHFFIPFILSNISCKVIPKGSFFGIKDLKGKCDIYVVKNIIPKDILPGEMMQFQLDCKSNKTLHKNLVVEIVLSNYDQSYEYNSFMINVDVEV